MNVRKQTAESRTENSGTAVLSGSFSVVHVLVLHASQLAEIRGSANRGIIVLEATPIRS
jgi:hypothetical protein